MPLFGTTTVTLADGEQQSKLTAESRVVLEPIEGSGDKPIVKIGVVILEPNSDEVLVGMDFLRTFGLAMVLASETVVLIEESDVPVQNDKAVKDDEPSPD